ncbi:hypothetical protein [Sphingomonas faeni]|uniref:hypothetical protein n=1 Tax=Sphingomonas faeni TaxID=185950 RepID=UPI0033631CE8
MSGGKWAWWAGRDCEEFTLAGPCLTREDAIDEAYGSTDPGDTIYLVEAIADDEVDEMTGMYPFVAQRNSSHVIRDEDKEPSA